MTSYRLNRAGFREHVLNAPWMVKEMERRAQRGYELAKSIAPDAVPLEVGYIASFVVFSGVNGGVRHDRAYAELANYSDHAVYVEFGSEHNDAHHVLTKASEAMKA